MPRVYRPNTYNSVTRKREDFPNIKWSDTTGVEKAKFVSKRAFSASLLAVAVIAALPNGRIDIFGDIGTKRTQAEKDELFRERQQEVFSQDMSPQTRYALSYIGIQSVCGGVDCYEDYSVTVNGIKNNNGILGYAQVALNIGRHNDIVSESPGDECLAGSSYDSTPSEVRGGEVSAVASVNLLDGVISVYPAATDAPALAFNISNEGFLVPNDDVTVGILEAYDCDIDIKR